MRRNGTPKLFLQTKNKWKLKKNCKFRKRTTKKKDIKIPTFWLMET